MYSEYCRNEFNDENTTTNETNITTESKSTTSDVKKRKRKHLIISLITTAVLLVFAWAITPNNNGDDSVAMVQNGYLGVYTDITVKETLDATYGSIYSNSNWDWGYSDSKELVVQAYYYNETEVPGVLVQFTVLENDDECFEVSYIEDPDMPIEDTYDFLVAVNGLCIQAHNEKIAADNEDSIIGMIGGAFKNQAKLYDTDSICASYGASADYDGNRSRICEIDGYTLTGISTGDLMDDAMYCNIFGEEYSEYK